MSDLNKNFSDKSNQVFIYKPKKASDKRRFGDSVVTGASSYTFPKPAPTIGVSSEIIMEKSDDANYTQGTAYDEVARKDTITFTGYFIPPLDSEGKVTINPGPATTQWIFQQHTELREAILQKFLTIELNDKSGALLDTFEDCNVVSIDFPADVNAQFGEYTLVFESYNTDNMDNDHIEYTYEFSVSEDSSMGYFSEDKKEVKTDAHLTGTESITVTALDLEDAKTFIEAKRKFDSSEVIYLAQGYNILDITGNGSVDEYKPTNITYNTSVNPTDGTVSYNSTFILVPQTDFSKDVLGTLNYTMNYDAVEDAYSGTITGSVMGITEGFKVTENESSNKAIECYDIIEAEKASKLKQLYPNLSQVTNEPVSTSVTRNYGASTIDFTLEFNDDGPDNFQVPNVSSEQITVSFNPQRDVFNQVPVIGRVAGPLLQTGNGKTERTKEFTLEVVYKPGFGDASGPGTEDIENGYKPTGTSQIYETAASTSWSVNERRFTRSKSWIYEYPSS
jgi:hypothetical protein